MACAGALTIIVSTALVVTSILGPPSTMGSRVLKYDVHSALLHQTLAQVAVVPPGPSSRRRPLLVFLHGKGGDPESSLGKSLFFALRRLGPQAPDIVFPYGGEDSYWHNRANGAWGSYVLKEVIPQALDRLDADPRRVAIGGLSMGGFGAYDLALSNPRRFCAVGGDSAAIWHSGGETAAGAFDDAHDFHRNDVLSAVSSSADPLPNERLWLDVGNEDPFRGADAALAQELKDKGLPVQFHVWQGAHDSAYWRGHWKDYLRFYASALAKC